MKKFLGQLVFALVAIMLPHFATPANACSCFPIPSPYEEYRSARAVFVGTVLSSRDVPSIERVRDQPYTVYERRFRFVVGESLKGVKSAEVEIDVGRVDSTCYTGFTVGERYLVYASGDSDESLGSGMCTRTTTLLHASDDLLYIRALLRVVPEPRVYGAVFRVDQDLTRNNSARSVPMQGFKIIVEGAGRHFEAVTDKQGLYSISKVPDGRYTARPVVPDKYRKYFPTEEEFVLGGKEQESFPLVHQGTSAYASFQIGWNNNLSGRIVDAEGNPIVRATVTVMFPHDSSPLVIAEDRHNHHPEGKYEFYGLTPGKYLLSVKVRVPFEDATKPTRFYYPNADDPDQANEISIGESETLEERDIRLPPGYLVRQIEGMLVWPNGVPVSGGWVFLASSKDSADDDKKYDWGRTDALGRFSLQAFVGAEYWVHGSSNSSGKGEPIKITVSKVNEPVKVVIPFPKRIDP